MICIIMFLSIILDVIVIYIGPIIVINQDFISSVYGALATVTAISVSVLTIVVNSFNDSYFGYKIKEILNFQNKFVKFQGIIPISFLMLILASFSLVFNLFNFIVALLISSVLLITSISLYAWKLISNSSFCKNIVINEFSRIKAGREQSQLDKAFKRIFNDLNKTVNLYGEKGIDEYRQIIKMGLKGVSLTEELATSINEEIIETFQNFYDIKGFIPAVDNILILYDFLETEYVEYDRQELLRKTVENIKYMDERDLVRRGVIQITKGLENVKVLDNSDKNLIIYLYFSSLYDNELIGKKMRMSLLEDMIHHLTDMRFSNENDYDEVKKQVLFRITKDFILTNEDEKVGKHLFGILVEELYRDGFIESYSNNYNVVAAEIYCALYFYSEYEVNTLSKNHRQVLKSYMNTALDSIHANRITFSDVIRTRFADVVKSLWELANNFDSNIKMFEYFPPRVKVKTTVWEEERVLKFAMLNYILCDYDCESFAGILLSKLGNGDVNKKKYLLRYLLNSFNVNNEELTDYEQRVLLDLSTWLGNDSNIDSSQQQQIFKQINDELKKIEDKFEENGDSQIELTEINQKLSAYLSNKKYHGYNSSLICDSHEMKLPPQFINLTHGTPGDRIIPIVSRYIEEFLNQHIKQVFKELEISFDQIGVDKLLDELSSSDFDKRNYTFVNDSSLREDIKSSTSFVKLRRIIKDIEMQKTSPYKLRMFYKKGSLDFNIKITDFTIETLNNEELSKLAEKYKVSDDYYRVDSAYLNKSQAMKAIKERFKKINMSFIYGFKESQDSGIIIKFKRRTIKK